MKKTCYIWVFAACLFFLLAPKSLASENTEGRDRYKKAIRFIKEKQYDFALLEFRAIIRDFPESRYTESSLFATGEYFYTRRAYYEASRNFTAYIERYPGSDGAIFARSYLLKIMQGIERPREEEVEALENMEMAFFSQPLVLLFSEYKEVSYKSAFQNNFTIRYYMDTIEVYRNDTLFLKLAQ